MSKFKLSILCDTLEEFEQAFMYLSNLKKSYTVKLDGSELLGLSGDSDANCVGETTTREPFPEASKPAETPPAEAPPKKARKPRGRPKKDDDSEAPKATPTESPKDQTLLPGVVTMDTLRARATRFAREWGAPSLIEVLKTFGVKSTADLKPEQFDAAYAAFEKFTMGSDEAPEDETQKGEGDDPFNDLL